MRPTSLTLLFIGVALVACSADSGCGRAIRHHRLPGKQRGGKETNHKLEFNKAKAASKSNKPKTQNKQKAKTGNKATIDAGVDLNLGSPTDSPFTLTSDYSGNNFFDNFDFFTYPDPTHGLVNYVNDPKLAYIDDSGKVIMKVDNSTDVASNRNSVRIVSKETFKQGQMLVFDATHIPTGFSTWPAFWLVGPQWPQQGEIDIVEGVNNLEQNQYTLHTSAGCTLSQPMNATGSILTTDCDAMATGNVGCGVQGVPGSYGSSFNDNGGGVYVTLWDDFGIRIWFFARSDIPGDISNETPNPDAWGKPAASWAASSCSASFFSDLMIVINTTLCGDWAGAVYNQNGGPGTCVSQVQSAKNFAEAYWQIKSVKTYSLK